MKLSCCVVFWACKYKFVTWRPFLDIFWLSKKASFLHLSAPFLDLGRRLPLAAAQKKSWGIVEGFKKRFETWVSQFLRDSCFWLFLHYMNASKIYLTSCSNLFCMFFDDSVDNPWVLNACFWCCEHACCCRCNLSSEISKRSPILRNVPFAWLRACCDRWEVLETCSSCIYSMKICKVACGYTMHVAECGGPSWQSLQANQTGQGV